MRPLLNFVFVWICTSNAVGTVTRTCSTFTTRSSHWRLANVRRLPPRRLQTVVARSCCPADGGTEAVRRARNDRTAPECAVVCHEANNIRTSATTSTISRWRMANTRSAHRRSKITVPPPPNLYFNHCVHGIAGVWRPSVRPSVTFMYADHIDWTDCNFTIRWISYMSSIYHESPHDPQSSHCVKLLSLGYIFPLIVWAYRLWNFCVALWPTHHFCSRVRYSRSRSPKVWFLC